MSICKAVSVVFKFQGKVFIIKRQRYLRNFPGYTAFPGGKVDGEDAHYFQTHTFPKEWKGLDPTLMATCIRETQEELSVNLEEFLREGQIKSSSLAGVATTPPFVPYRFETYFFIFELNSLPELNFDQREIEKAKWWEPLDWLRAYERGEELVTHPTLALIKSFSQGQNQISHLNLNLSYCEKEEVPVLHPLGGVIQFLPLSATLPPAQRTNSFLIGDKGARKVLIDPSPHTQKECDRFLKTIENLNLSVDLIFITHHHGDHHQRAVSMAKELGATLAMSRGTQKRIEEKWGAHYWSGISLECFAEGDFITVSSKQKVRVYEVPGHDEGQLALAPQSLNWFLVGDLIQSIGTVFIGGEEGDMAKYFSSLKRVIKLAPRFVMPSHGIVLGGIHQLEATLKHRLHREEQIKKLFQKGKNEGEILEEVYVGLSPRLKPYALKTIEAHLKKIGANGV